MTQPKNKPKFCKCGCGEPCTAKFKKGHHMRILSQRKRQQLAKELGSKGGLARAKRLTKARRQEIAIKAGYARHGRLVQRAPTAVS